MNNCLNESLVMISEKLENSKIEYSSNFFYEKPKCLPTHKRRGSSMQNIETQPNQNPKNCPGANLKNDILGKQKEPQIDFENMFFDKDVNNLSNILNNDTEKDFDINQKIDFYERKRQNWTHNVYHENKEFEENKVKLLELEKYVNSIKHKYLITIVDKENILIEIDKQNLLIKKLNQANQKELVEINELNQFVKKNKIYMKNVKEVKLCLEGLNDHVQKFEDFFVGGQKYMGGENHQLNLKNSEDLVLKMNHKIKDIVENLK